MPTMAVRCTAGDLEYFNAAALVAGFCKVDPSEPNRSGWLLAVLRQAAESMLNEDQETFLKNRKARHGGVSKTNKSKVAESNKHPTRAKRATAVRSTPGHANS